MFRVMNNMDKILKLKLEVVYRGLAIDQARQSFNDLKEQQKVEPIIIKPKRKLKK